MPPVVRKFSQIAASAVNLASNDKILGVQAGATDVLFSTRQVKQGIDPELDADTSYYIRTDGSDSNTGLVDSAAGAWLTLQHAIDFLTDIELGGFTATVNIGSGSFDGVSVTRGNKSGIIVFDGGANNPVINATGAICFNVLAPVTLGIERLTCVGNNVGTGIYAIGDGTIVNIYAVSYTNLDRHIFADYGSDISVAGNTTVTGNAVNSIKLFYAGVSVNGSAWTLTGTPAYSDAFISLNDQSLFHVYALGMTFTNSATGKRFFVADGSVINTGSNSLTFFPGNVAGTVSTNGQYDNITANSDGGVIVTNLPPVGVVPQGQRAFVTDSTVTYVSSNIGLVVTGGSSNLVPVYSDGTDWRIG